MKKLLIAMCTIMVFASLNLFHACKKESEPKDPCSEGPVYGGIVGSLDKNVTFWISKDFGCGPLTFVSVTNKTNGDTNYRLTGKNTITVFNNGQPACEATGTVTALLPRGRTFIYKFKCSSREFTGEFSTDCTNNCQLVEVK